MLSLVASVVAAAAGSVVAPPAKVLVVGAGPVCVCAAKLAALRGYQTTCLAFPEDCNRAASLIYSEKLGCVEGSLPLTFIPIAGPDAEEAQIEATAAEADGLILAIDGENTFGVPVLDTLIRPGGKLQRVALMSRSLNGNGMGLFANAAKFAANKEVWDGNVPAVKKYREMELNVISLAEAAGASHSIVRAGTLKGGGCGAQDREASEGEPQDEQPGGERTLLTSEVYKLGQQDVVNWRLIYDCDALGVELLPGDTLPGPGALAALTATEKVGAGDSHRGAVAACLVEALRAPAAAGRDFSVRATAGRRFPSEEELGAMFAAAA